MNKKLSLFSLTLLIITAIDNVRNLPSAALFGSSLLFFFPLSALFFLLPTALVSAELSSAFPKNGGVYHWVNKAFGPRAAMLAIWLQWINTMIWYPSMLLFIAGTAAYLVDPSMAQNKSYLIVTTLVIFWSLTWINLKGIQASATVNNYCGVLGTLLPMTILVILGGVWVLCGKPVQIELTKEAIIPSTTQGAHFSSLVAIMASFLGMELSGVHVKDILEPQKNFPKAAFMAVLFILISMSLGSLAIATVLPKNEISLVSGVMQVFSNFFAFFGLQALIPIITLLIVIGSLGTMINWLISPAKGLLHAAEFGFLPPFFLKENKAGVPQNILLIQGALVSFLCLLFLLDDNLNAFYWFYTALSTGLYMLMYALMFAAGLRLHYTVTDRTNAFKIPGGSLGIWVTCFLGMIGVTTTVIVSFFPPESFQIKSYDYALMIALGNLLAISPVLLFYLYRNFKSSILQAEPTRN